MIVRCVHNKGRDAFDGYKIPIGYSDNSEWSLKIGATYLVMGILLGEGLVSYLIDEGGEIASYPFHLFTIVQHDLNSKWYFKQFTKNDDLFPYTQAIYGYYELVFDSVHYQKLIEGDKEALQVYFMNKSSLEKEIGYDIK